MTRSLTLAELDRFSRGRYSLTQTADGRFLAWNVRTGVTLTRPRSRLSAARIARRAAALDARAAATAV